MSPQYYPYRVVYRVAGEEHVWTRYGVDKAKVEDLARRALKLVYRGAAELVEVELEAPDRSNR